MFSYKTVSHDFLVFMVLKSPEICLRHLSGNPEHHPTMSISDRRKDGGEGTGRKVHSVITTVI